MNRRELDQILADAKSKGIHADLRGANLDGANLGWANLGGADLGGANLGGANLLGANLRRANLSGANLSGANLSEANLSEANLSGANLNQVIGINYCQGGGSTNKGYIMTGIVVNNEVRLWCGCKLFITLAEMREHIKKNEADTDGLEIVDWIESHLKGHCK
jgi:uncharacterized protein YjbI with pentapeptide repeats